jgi:hypothetical protein
MAESVLIIDPQFKVTMAPVPVLAVLFRPARLQHFARMKAAQTLNLPATGGRTKVPLWSGCGGDGPNLERRVQRNIATGLRKGGPRLRSAYAYRHLAHITGSRINVG